MIWYRITDYHVHLRTQRHTTAVYFYANNTIEAMNKYQQMPGVKKGLRRRTFPTIEPLSAQQASALEERINSEGKLPLYKAKKRWYLASMDLAGIEPAASTVRG